MLFLKINRLVLNSLDVAKQKIREGFLYANSVIFPVLTFSIVDTSILMDKQVSLDHDKPKPKFARGLTFVSCYFLKVYSKGVSHYSWPFVLWNCEMLLLNAPGKVAR